MVRQWQELFFDRRYSEVTMENPDFIKLASAYGVHGERVEDRDDLTNAVAHATDDRPYLLEVCVGAEDNIFPMIPSGASVMKSALSEIDDKDTNAETLNMNRHQFDIRCLNAPPFCRVLLMFTRRGLPIEQLSWQRRR